VSPACLAQERQAIEPAIDRPAAAQQDADELEVSGARVSAPNRRTRSAFKLGVDGVLIEVAALPEQPDASQAAWVRASPYVLWQPSRNWEFRAGVQATVEHQGGVERYTEASVAPEETYIRWRGGETRLTIGAQKIIWGRVDALPLIDRVSRADISRGLLDDLAERRQAQWALRWEQTWDELKVDAVALPAFLAADVPDAQSVWNPVNRRSGRVLGVAPSPALSALATGAGVRQEGGGWGGAALRLTRTGLPADVGLTFGRTRQSLPFFEADSSRGGLNAVHPFNSFVGLDAEWVAGDVTWRSELVYTRDLPVTALQGRRVSASAVDWVGALEFFPGGKDTRLNLQILARHLQTDEPVLQLTRYVGVNGEIESSFGQGRWKAALQFASGLSIHDLYLAPRVSYAGWEPHELSLSMHAFRGNERTLGGFYRDNLYLALGVRTRF
jgi:PAS domain-containing protein